MEKEKNIGDSDYVVTSTGSGSGSGTEDGSSGDHDNRDMDIEKKKMKKKHSGQFGVNKNDSFCFGCQELLTSGDGSSSSSSGGSAVVNKASAVSVGGSGNKKMTLQCPRCHNIFCVECDIFIHDSLHNCPGCYLLE